MALGSCSETRQNDCFVWSCVRLTVFFREVDFATCAHVVSGPHEMRFRGRVSTDVVVYVVSLGVCLQKELNLSQIDLESSKKLFNSVIYTTSHLLP